MLEAVSFLAGRIREVNLLFGVPLNMMKNMVLQDPSAMKIFIQEFCMQ